MSESNKFVANVVRRTWDLSEYEAKAAEKNRAEEEAEAEADAKRRNVHRKQQAVVVRAPLKHRSQEVQLESRLGKHSVISTSTPLSARGGYYCPVCECLLKDSLTFLDHINGKKHQKALGMTLRAERSTLGQVQSKFQEARRKAEEQAHGSELEQRLARFQEEVEHGKRARKDARRDEEARKAEAELRALAAEAQFDMGATTSESRKRKKAAAAADGSSSKDGAVEDEDEEGEAEGADDAEAAAASKKAKSDASSSSSSAAAAATSSTPAAAAEEEDPEAAMMRMMGFATGFAAGKNKQK